MQRIRDDQRDAAVETLAIAFHDDPLLEIVSPDRSRRAEIGRWFMRGALAMGLPRGETWVNDDASAVAIWLPPGGTDIGMVEMLRAGLWRLPLMVGLGGAGRVMGALGATEQFHKTVHGPHWYLMSLATRPERQGQGLGGQLMAIGLDQADAAGLPVYLETATDANIAFYGKRGFEVVGQAQVAGHTLTGMVRPPRAAGTA